MMKTLHGLYAITDEKLMPVSDFNAMAEAALSSGVKIIQYRDKSNDTTKRLNQASALRTLCDTYNAILIINDDIDLAISANADGIHIGQDDLSIEQARQHLGQNKIIGVSCYDQTSLAEAAIANGADYIAFGSFFGSRIKPNAPKAKIHLISAIKNSHATPVCCIGGITLENCNKLLAEKADMLAVISELFISRDTNEIKNKCRKFIQAFKTSTSPF